MKEARHGGVYGMANRQRKSISERVVATWYKFVQRQCKIDCKSVHLFWKSEAELVSVRFNWERRKIYLHLFWEFIKAFDLWLRFLPRSFDCRYDCIDFPSDVQQMMDPSMSNETLVTRRRSIIDLIFTMKQAKRNQDLWFEEFPSLLRWFVVVQLSWVLAWVHF